MTERSAEWLDGRAEGLRIAARALRRRLPDGSALATDLEDLAAAFRDPAKCSHPFQAFGRDGRTFCRSCLTETTHMEMMGS